MFKITISPLKMITPEKRINLAVVLSKNLETCNIKDKSFSYISAN